MASISRFNDGRQSFLLRDARGFDFAMGTNKEHLAYLGRRYCDLGFEIVPIKRKYRFRDSGRFKKNAKKASGPNYVSPLFPP